jgi:hypothetical protein
MMPTKTVLGALALSLVLGTPLSAAVLWSQPRDFYVDPPEGWTFVEDPTPEHFVMTDASRHLILEIFTQDKTGETLEAKASGVKTRLQAQGDEEVFEWNGSRAWLGDLKFRAGPVDARGWALVAENKNSWITALAYAPVTDYDHASDTLISALDSLALGQDGRKLPGPLSAFFEAAADQPRSESLAVAGLPSAFTLVYSLDRDESIQATTERETRILTAQLGPHPTSQTAMAPGWSRFYRQIYRELYSSLVPLAAYWKSRLDAGRLTKDTLPQAVLSWLQKYDYSRKGGLTDLSTPWQTLKEKSGDCDSKSLIYLALMQQLGYSGILMVSGTLSHGMAALDVPGAGARFSFDGSQWLVAELTAQVNLGMIAQDMADPAQWIGVDLWAKP